MSQTKLAAKLVNILSNLSSVPKKGYNKHQQYHYMREVDVMEALKAQLIENKIIMLTSSKFADIQKKEGKEGKVEFVTTVETTHTFLDSDTQEQLSITSVGSGYDASDKGASKAITAAVKYAIMKTFMISDEGADIENDGVTAQPPVTTAKKSFNRSSNKMNQEEVDALNAALEVKKNQVATIPQSEAAVISTSGTIVTNLTPTVGGATTKPRFSGRNTTKTEPSFP